VQCVYPRDATEDLGLLRQTQLKLFEICDRRQGRMNKQQRRTQLSECNSDYLQRDAHPNYLRKIPLK